MQEQGKSRNEETLIEIASELEQFMKGNLFDVLLNNTNSTDLVEKTKVFSARLEEIKKLAEYLETADKISEEEISQS